jgi:hypothetical protein
MNKLAKSQKVKLKTKGLWTCFPNLKPTDTFQGNSSKEFINGQNQYLIQEKFLVQNLLTG